ncbi:MAG: hypothetical protein ACR2H5_03170 [Ktedonobacteraceae bacterium]
MTTFAFAPSIYLPIAIGYFVWGGQALFGFPEETPEVNRTMGMWAVWMPGFMQFITGIVLLIGLTWFNVFGKGGAPLYMAALAFTAYGIHWFAMGHRRFIGASAQPDAWMAIAFFVLSVLGVVFIAASDVPVAIVFIGLSLIYLSEFPFRFGFFSMGGRLVAV